MASNIPRYRPLLRALILEADYGLGRNRINMVQMTGLGSRCVQQMFTTSRNDGVSGVHPGHTPYMNAGAWGRGYMADPQFTRAAPSTIGRAKNKFLSGSEEYAFYCTSAAPTQYSAQQLLQTIRDHWGANENGSHYRRDVSLGEDASRISGRSGAYVMATLRNLLLGLMELHRHRGKTEARTFPGWRRKLTTSQKIQLITRDL